jgi:aspartyl/asparaginyl beta-hydroxylase (cupin superfamily)
MITKDTFLYRLIAASGLRLIAGTEWLISKNSPNNTFFDTKAFPWTETLESNYPQIKNELHSLLESRSIPDFTDLSEEQKRIVSANKWKTFIFCLYGKYVEENCQICPITSSAIRKIPGIEGAFFSILEPGTHISRHRGPYKGVLRCHLALVVPPNETSCAIEVNAETYHWKEGKTVVFDDTFEHEAWNNSNQLRVVLFIDFERPLPVWLVPMNKFMLRLISISPFVRNIFTNVERYEKYRPAP